MNARLIKLLAPTVVIMQLATGVLTTMPSAMPAASGQPATLQPQQPITQPPALSQLATPQPITPQPAAQPLATAAAQPAAQQINPALFKELDTALQGIEQTKQSLAKLLQELDAKLLDARKQAAEAKNLSLGLLNKEQEQEAKGDFEKIRNTGKDIQATQQYVQVEFSKSFNDKVSELRVKATQAESALKAIKAAKATPTTQAPATTPAALSPVTAPVQPTTNTASSGVFDSMTTGIASVVGGVKNFFSADDEAKKKTVTTPRSNEPVPADAAQRSREATAMVQQMDQGLQTIDATRNTIQQYIQTITQSTNYIEGLAKENTETARILAESKKPTATPAEPKWKRTILHIMSKTLDGIGAMASNLYALFDATIGRFTRTLIKDVATKVAIQDAPKSTPGAA